jgi:hypothetical protein
VEPERIAEFLVTVNAKYDAGVTTEFLDPAVGQSDPLDVPRVVSLGTAGMALPGPHIDPFVQNLWGLTRRRALDFGRVTTAAC